MLAVVTGAAGFIGSTLTDALLAAGHRVRGIDAFTDYYARARKESNLVAARANPDFELHEDDLRVADLRSVVAGADVVFHLAAQPGVRMSWHERFDDYVSDNVLATHRLLEAAHEAGVGRVVYASSSSVYGEAAVYPCVEDQPPAPFSPYGVTKLAGEHLCRAYAANFGLSTVCLRYFTVYGPRQRPDMAIHRLVEAGLGHGSFEIYGDGSQVRDFTFVGDVVAATMAAARADVAPGTVLNVAGGSSTTLAELIRLVGEAVGEPVPLVERPAQPGDVSRTGGATIRARDLLDWVPATSLADGVAAQVLWHRASSG